MINKLKTKPEKLLLIFTLVLAFFFRFYNTPYRYSFGEDSIRDALVALEGARELQLPLTGSFSSLGPFTFGPWYYYQLIIFSLTHIPYAPWIFMGLQSVLLVFIMYKIGEYLQGKYFGILLSLLVCVASSQISIATELSNPNLVPLYSALSILIFLKIINKNLSRWWSFLLGISLGIGINIHYQMAGLLILLFFLLSKKQRNWSNFLAAISGLVITFIPLLIFDLNNHWFTFKNLVYYYTQGRKAIYVPNRWLFYIRDFWPMFVSYVLGVNQIVGILAFLSIPAAIVALFKKKVPKPLLFLIISFVFNFILLRYYWGPRSFAYLQYMTPFIFIFVSYFILAAFKVRFGKYIAYSILALLLISILPNSFKQFDTNSFTIYMQNEASILGQSNKKLSIYNCETNYKFRSEAIVYLLSLKNKISENGFKIGFKDTRCPYPPTSKYTSYEATSSAVLLEDLYPTINGTDAFDISKATEEARVITGWSNISPKVIYNSNVRWWFKEQP